MPIVTKPTDFAVLKERFERSKKIKQEKDKKYIYGSVELPDNIENEYKELDKREIGILNRELNNFINDNISFYSGNGEKAVLGTNFNEMYNVLFDNKDLKNIKDESFLYHARSLTKLLLGIVNCNEKDYKDYNMDIVINSENKKQEIKKVCEKLFLNILTRKYDILKKQYNLDFKLPSREINKSRSGSMSKDTVSSAENSDNKMENTNTIEKLEQATGDTNKMIVSNTITAQTI